MPNAPCPLFKVWLAGGVTIEKVPTSVARSAHNGVSLGQVVLGPKAPNIHGPNCPGAQMSQGGIVWGLNCLGRIVLGRIVQGPIVLDSHLAIRRQHSTHLSRSILRGRSLSLRSGSSSALGGPCVTVLLTMPKPASLGALVVPELSLVFVLQKITLVISTATAVAGTCLAAPTLLCTPLLSACAFLATTLRLRYLCSSHSQQSHHLPSPA